MLWLLGDFKARDDVSSLGPPPPTECHTACAQLPYSSLEGLDRRPAGTVQTKGGRVFRVTRVSTLNVKAVALASLHRMWTSASFGTGGSREKRSYKFGKLSPEFRGVCPGMDPIPRLQYYDETTRGSSPEYINIGDDETA
jgi:hypothetical protein